MKIFKYELELADKQIVTMPNMKWILDAQIQTGKLCVWAMVDENRETEDLTFYIFGTGNPIPEDIGYNNLFYIGSVQDRGFVWHVFFEREEY